ncbi:MAG: TolC family protein [candidate division Zixibacteria bacterium]|nr:TolC family protein [candidate division Zixibacteria bacterium]
MNGRQNEKTTLSAKKLSSLLFFSLLISMSPSVSTGAEIALTVNDIRQRALEFNRGYLSAREDISLAQSEVTKARSGALPQVNLSVDYSRNLKIPSQFVQFGDEIEEMKFGFKNNFSYGLSVQQPLWHGGKVFTAYKIAKDYRRYAVNGAEAVKASVVYNAEILFYATILESARWEVYKKAFEANSHNFDVAEKKFNQGMASKYEYLRAQVERDNLKPLLIKAESDVNLAKKRLKSYLGYDLNDEIAIIEEKDDTSLTGLLPLVELVAKAVKERPEMIQAEYLTRISQRAIRVAKGGFYPSFDAFMQYGWQGVSDDFTLKENNSRSWTTGVTMSLPIFNGGLTFGEVSASKAQYNQAKLAERQVRDDIRLEVEAAYDALFQAKKSLDIQGVTIAQAEEGLRIANLRYESGVGTQLEVLSAQAALTDARTALAEALFMFRQAKAGLKKATTIDINNTEKDYEQE